MQAVILCGGLGTRISEETDRKPKPMIDIGGKPMLWHIMKHYSTHGINDFIIPLGYMGYVVKEYFANYHLHTSDITFDRVNDKIKVHCDRSEAWRITLVETGEKTMTGGRLKGIRDYLDVGTFCLTYGDGLTDLDIAATIAFHKKHGAMATVTAVRPPSRFGLLEIDGDAVTDFQEKVVRDSGWISGGFFVLEPKVIDYIDGEATSWEKAPLQKITAEGQLKAFKHDGFWYCMDTLRDKVYLQELWDSGNPPWVRKE